MPPHPTTEPSSLPPPLPSPSFCYTPFALRTFLRQSRALIDDPISQQLSAFAAPADRPLQPFSPAQTGRTASSSRLPEGTCAEFISRVLLPAWNERSRIIAYCGDVARSEDQGDPERSVREAEVRRKEGMVVDERLDPYSARFEVRESRRDRLAREVGEEWEVEEIVRRRSWGVLRTRCLALKGEWSDVAPVPTAAGGSF